MPILLKPNLQNIKSCAKKLNQGEIVAFPTETVYGLGANATIDSAIKRIYSIKNRPKNNPLIVHFCILNNNLQFDKAETFNIIKDNFKINTTFENIYNKLSSGPISYILEKKTTSKISSLCSSNNLQAFRIPKHPIAQQLIHFTQNPIAAPSANISNYLSPTTAQHVQKGFLNEKDLIILDSDRSSIGLESTVINISNEDKIEILRFGSITIKDLEKCNIKANALKESANKFLSPGMLKKHYSPSASVRLNAKFINEDEALLAFGEIDFPIHSNTYVLNLSKEGNLIEAAFNLFNMLWELDNMGVKKIAIMSIPNIDIGIAINERLKKAAT